MSRSFHHVGIAVKNIRETLKLFEVLNLKPAKEVETPNMKAAFIFSGGSEIELLEPKDPGHPIAKFIAERGEGVHHISMQVDDIEQALEELKRKGIKVLDEKPKIGVHGVNIAFLNPESTNGILIELCEEEK
jgi:methylmalonyl-CoA/ethylmalonyl-CoA epimerase